MKFTIPLLCFLVAFSACSRSNEMSLEELEALNAEGLHELLAKTQTKPWRGEDFAPGRLGGTWNSSMIKDPKSFNHLIAERDAETADIMRRMTEFLIEYDVVRREWKARCASAQIVVNEENQTLDVIYTLRGDLYWSYYNSDRKVPVTSDDVIFWYDEIEGDENFQSSAYNGQFLTMEDGSDARITIHKIDEKRFRFHFPRIIADPLLSTNRDFGPRHVYEPAKRGGGVQGVLDLFSVASDPKLIPSMGQWFLVEYVPSQRLVFKRNPHYWKKDSAGTSLPFVEENIEQILPDQNTQYLVFKQGNLESYSARPEDLNELVNRENASYTVFNAEGNIGAALWSFNQNPQNSAEPYYEWFTHKEFRQAMSCLLNRARINAQVYRGLAEPKLDFFPPPNPYYNPDIVLEYQYNPERALTLLESAGFTRDRRGALLDAQDRRVEFDLSFTADNTVTADIASILVDELSKVGIKVNIRATDFQKLVEQLTGTYDWQSIIIGLGTNFFPTQGSNVWPSTGNLHLWHPLQEKPHTDWEARIDYLYNEGSYTIDRAKASVIWDEYQRLILEQCPIIYLMRSRSFWALQNRWDFSNVYYDNLNGAEITHIFLK
ncbi:MAG: ABC transporter substrate-binding protein [Treponema sp.]|nr:ABC transporter substrate-binding protein [Treponema sp.]